MTTTSNITPVSDAINSLMALLTPAERAAVAGNILSQLELTEEVVTAWADELTETDLETLAEQIV